ncbi:MAG TPA: hypothetical protein VKG25_28370 [Bryobacteraceae bacterium]|nr:hypothetical protein [Bryobacteraceae bacterium]
MTIEIHDAALESRLQQQMQATGAATAEEALRRLLDTQQELDRWLLESREFINAKIRRGIEQLDRGEGIPGDVAWERLQQRKTAWLEQHPATEP